MGIFEFLIDSLIDMSLKEDLALGDVTTDTLISPSDFGNAIIKAKASGILAGTQVAQIVLRKVDPSLKVDFLILDGGKLRSGDVICKIEGNISSILKAERLTLNFLQHLSGIATLTSVYVQAVEGLPVNICDTRKTIPGMRMLEKQAVACGGGMNHRISLGDSILIKNNHIIVCQKKGIGLKEIIQKARKQANFPAKSVEIEVSSVKQSIEAAEAQADIIMLDNMPIDEMRKAVQAINKRSVIEASGGVNIENVRQIAETGVDVISIGAITHSVKALDISLTVL